MGWSFIAIVGTNLAWYGKGGERLLVDTVTMGILLYSAGGVLITSGVVKVG